MRAVIKKEVLRKRCAEIIHNVSMSHLIHTHAQTITQIINDETKRKYWIFGPTIKPNAERIRTLLQDKKVVEKARKKAEDNVVTGDSWRIKAEDMVEALDILDCEEIILTDENELSLLTVWNDEPDHPFKCSKTTVLDTFEWMRSRNVNTEENPRTIKECVEDTDREDASDEDCVEKRS